MNDEKKTYVADPQETANNMWYKVQLLSRDYEWTVEDTDKKLLDMRDAGFGNFINKYPIISRQMIVNGEYHSLAFASFLRNDAKSGSGKDEWAHIRATYIKDLWIHLNSKDSSKRRKKLKTDKEANRVYKDTKEKLLYELTSFKKDYELAKESLDNENKKMAEDIRNELKLLYVENPYAIRGVL